MSLACCSHGVTESDTTERRGATQSGVSRESSDRALDRRPCLGVVLLAAPAPRPPPCFALGSAPTGKLLSLQPWFLWS